MKRVKFIYNPYSGENTIITDLDKVFKINQKHGFYVEPYRVSFETPVENAFNDFDDSFSYILVAGGDGTVDLTVNSMKKKNINIPLGILPTGTANDFAKFIGMSTDVEEACEQILKYPPKNVDLGRINDNYFINVASFGLFTDISQKTDIELKNTIGKLAYYIKGIEQIPNFKKLKVNVSSKEGNFNGDMFLMLIFNGQTAGNLKFAYKSKIDDGLLDVIIIKAGMLGDMVNLLFEILKGAHLKNSKGLLYFKSDDISIECTEGIVTDIDGERGPDFPLRIRCEKGSLKVLGIK